MEPADGVDGRPEGDLEQDNERPPQVSRRVIPRGERDPRLFDIDLIPAIWPDEFGRGDIGDNECFEVPAKPAAPPAEYVIKDSDDESTKAKKIMYVFFPCFQFKLTGVGEQLLQLAQTWNISTWDIPSLLNIALRF